MSDTISITIKSSGDKKYPITIDPTLTVADLKGLIEVESSIPADSQRLIYSGKVLKDGDSLVSYKVQDGHTIHLVKSAAKKSTSDTPAAATTSNSSAPAAAAASSSTSPSAASAIPHNIAAGQGANNPFAALTGARYAGANIPMPSADLFGPDGGMQMPDPAMMDEMMNSPMYQEALNNMMSDPQMLDFLIQQSPQLRALGPQAREMMQSPMFRSMLSNPQFMRSAMQMQRGGMGGAAAQSAFPAPGDPNAPTADAAANSTTTPSADASNPFAALLGGNPFGGAGAAGSAAGSGANMPNFADFFGMGNPYAGANPYAAAGAGAAAAPPADTRPPEEIYESQLRQLNDMGFFDFDQNVRALRRCGGSVQGAIEYLLNN